MNKITTFTDGASKGNPGPGGWGAVVVSGGQTVELGGGEKNTTNNRMELTSVIEALKYLSSSKLFPPKADQPWAGTVNSRLTIYSDSSYVISGATKWLTGWQKRHWQTAIKEPVLNRDLWEEFLKLNKFKIHWHQVGGHIGVAGNERADEIASNFASGVRPKLFNGPSKNYHLDLTNLTHNLKQKSDKDESRSRSRAKAYSYVSKVDGVIGVYATWAECEKNVKGKRGARYKKSLSAQDERAIIKCWQ